MRPKIPRPCCVPAIACVFAQFRGRSLRPSLRIAKTITEILHSVEDDNAMNAVVTRAGFLTSVQDLGRTGVRQFGVSTSGALDSFALRVANLLVGNHEGAG